jgi:hypothetical protein
MQVCRIFINMAFHVTFGDHECTKSLDKNQTPDVSDRGYVGHKSVY